MNKIVFKHDRVKFTEEECEIIENDFIVQLVEAILMMAIKDCQNETKYIRKNTQNTYDSYKTTALYFVRSKMFRELCDAIGKEPTLIARQAFMEIKRGRKKTMNKYLAAYSFTNKNQKGVFVINSDCKEGAILKLLMFFKEADVFNSNDEFQLTCINIDEIDEI